jgi:hypothetical protein
MRKPILAIISAALLIIVCGLTLNDYIATYTIIDSGQDLCYDTTQQIPFPNPSDPFYGQDAQYEGTQFSFQNNSNGTVTDMNTGLMWQQMPALYDKSTFSQALAGADTFSLAGYNDWRLPSIKELYSLIDFRGSSITLTPYIDTSYFGFRFGDTTLGERVIDGQYWSSTKYVGLTMGGDSTVFGANFADGRIKGYGKDMGPNGIPTQFVRYVRGNSSYGINNFVDNNDGTITDIATGLIWQKADNGDTLNWEEALSYAENQTLAGHSDWRLPTAKELQSIVDYTRAPDATNPSQKGPAIDTSYFDITNIGTGQDPDYGYFWTSTTLLETPSNMGTGSHAVYLCFGQAWGWMEVPPNSNNYVLMNVHGAGSQRSDPKSGDASNWPHGNGPQGDVVRIYNYVRCVRGGAVVPISIKNNSQIIPNEYKLKQNYPNPFNPTTTIEFSIPNSGNVSLKIYNILGKEVATIYDGFLNAGSYSEQFDGSFISSGVYFYRITAGDPDSNLPGERTGSGQVYISTKKMVLVK